MYLSRLVLDPGNWQVRRDLADCQELHRTLLRAFPDGPTNTPGDATGARARCGLLYRVEAGRTSRGITVLVQSIIEPNWDLLPNGYVTACACKPITAAYESIADGMRLRFRLRANPTRRIARARDAAEARWVGKRVQLFRDEEQLAWLARKGQSHGFRLVQVRTVSSLPVNAVQIAPEGVITGRKASNGQTHSLTFGSVLFEGELEVINAEAFRLALVQGIGSAKAYGFGLLSVAWSGRDRNRVRSDEGPAHPSQSAG